MPTLCRLHLRIVCICVLACAFAASHSPLATAQAGFASISGRVADPSGAVIQKADVTLKNLDTGVVLATQTNNEGIYNLPSVKPGNYVMRVQKEGFRSVDVTGLTLYVQDQLARNFSLETGSVSESITVSADQNNINTTDGSVSTVIDRNFVANMPLNGRSFQDLIALTPGVVTQSPQTGNGYPQGGPPDRGDFSVNGQRTESNNYTVDGISANTSPGAPGLSAGTGGGLGSSTVLGTTQSLLSIDALQEFRIESSTYSAEYGGSPGGQFSFVSRSGTSSLHGSLFEYLRNDVFDANDWFNDYLNAPKPPLRQNDFGGTVGGPLWIPKLHEKRDRTFFFFSYEGLRLIQPTAATVQYVPSNSLRTSAASVLQPVMNAFPVPTGPEIQIACDNVNYSCGGQPVGTLVPSGLAPFVRSYSLPANIDSSSLRFDQAIRGNLHLFLRAAYTPNFSSSRTLSELFSFVGSAQNYAAGADIQISSAVSDQLRLGYSRSISSQVGTLDNFGGAAPTNYDQAFGDCCSPNGEPGVNVVITGIGSASLSPHKSSVYQHQWNPTDIVDWEVGRHSLKAGLSYRWINSPYSPVDPIAAASYYSPMSIDANNADGLFILRQRASSPVYNQFALFIQDEWKVTASLNLSMGLRWELQPPPTSINAIKPNPLVGNIDDPSTYTLGAPGASLYKTTWDNFAPRLGIAWRLHGGDGQETALRGGIGIFYDTGTQDTAVVFVGVANSVYESLANQPLPVTPAQIDIPFSAAPPYSEPQLLANNFKLPYTMEWNLALEQALGREQSLSLTYVGSNGRRLVAENFIDGGALNPDFNGIVLQQNQTTSNYQALQVQFRRQVRQGLQALGSYTWSHSLDFGSNGGDLGYNYARGNSDFDVRSNFNAGLSWDLPLNQGSLVSKALLNGWGLDARIFARTGFPVSLAGNFFVNPVTGAGTYSGLDIVPGEPFYTYSSKLPGGREINSNAFTAVAANEVGNAPRNFLRGFGEEQLNLALRREFPLWEKLRLQFRAETFNILNHPNFGYIDPNVGDATFGQAQGTLANGLATVNALYQQGGNRSMQFAVKVVF